MLPFVAIFNHASWRGTFRADVPYDRGLLPRLSTPNRGRKQGVVPVKDDDGAWARHGEGNSEFERRLGRRGPDRVDDMGGSN